ncbi:hypothetical protein PTTG_09711 [Puccinia triticina 1-1 BBBD Race 1]|uniref:WD_REPEATS_REGION domain-containing protein n=1 Tax=Puccinia triticina (isolate 1-1 / race 1 (BBBD)) TaxID=630390 RepID=A0A180GML4_PUCT1|nr:hypothetical protein PTTG_09711 [Puccinia triticina 1-1 BBBD Race 1]
MKTQDLIHGLVGQDHQIMGRRVLLSTSTGHINFVKSIHIIPNLGLLVSGSTDRDIRLWDFKQSIESFDWSEIEAQCHAQRRAKIKANQSKTEQEIAAEDAIEDAPAGLPNFNSPSLSTQTNGGWLRYQ